MLPLRLSIAFVYFVYACFLHILLHVRKRPLPHSWPYVRQYNAMKVFGLLGARNMVWHLSVNGNSSVARVEGQWARNSLTVCKDKLYSVCFPPRFMASPSSA